MEIELRCDGYENRARTAEIRYRDAVRVLHEMKETQQLTTEQLETIGKNPRFDNELKIDTARILRNEAMRLLDTPVSAMSTGSNGSVKSDSPKKPDLYDSPSPPSTTSLTREALVSRILEGNATIYFFFSSPYSLIFFKYIEYADDTDIELFVRDCAIASHRNIDKAHEWANKLKDQDIMTVGDLRDLHDEDWVGIGLTVFALRALKNMLKGKKQAIQPNSSTNGTPSTISSHSTRVSPPL